MYIYTLGYIYPRIYIYVCIYNLIIHIDLVLQFENNFHLGRQHGGVERLSLLETFSRYLFNGWLTLGKLFNFFSLAISEKREQKYQPITHGGNVHNTPIIVPGTGRS